MDYSPPGSSVQGIFQARILEWVDISYFRGSFRPRDQIKFASLESTTAPPGKPHQMLKIRANTVASTSKSKSSKNSPLFVYLYVAAAAGVADPSVHLPVALGRRWAREAPGGGKCAVAQRRPRSRARLAHRGPPLICMPVAMFLQLAALGREKRRIKLDHVRNLLPAPFPAQGTSQQGQRMREGDWSQSSYSDQQP